jgi:hypothetical protein
VFVLNLPFDYTNSLKHSGLAQLVEQWTVNPFVAGSSPASGDFKRAFLSKALFFYPPSDLISKKKKNLLDL